MHHLIPFVSLIAFLLSNFTFSSPKTLPVLFSNIYVNGAWGYQYEGWLIDSSGVIRNFSFNASDSMNNLWFYDPTGAVCGSDSNRTFCRDGAKLTRNYCAKMLSLSIATNRKVPADTIEAMRALIQGASKGLLSSGGQCNDAGEDSYIAYMPDPIDSLCSQVLCYQRGDQWTCNASSEAKKLSKWLFSLDSVYRDGFCEAPDSACNPMVDIKYNIPPCRNMNASGKIPENDQFGLDGKKVSNFKRKVVVSGKAKVSINMK